MDAHVKRGLDRTSFDIVIPRSYDMRVAIECCSFTVLTRYIIWGVVARSSEFFGVIKLQERSVYRQISK
jgi:hypothetical protein